MTAAEHCIMGVDPGLSGAIAFYFRGHPALIAAEDVPVAGNEIDVATLAQRVGQMAPTLAVIEHVGAMPGQGVASMFKFGMAAGVVRGVIAALGIPTHLVAPTRPTSEHFSRKKDHGRAEAALLARYGAEVILAEGGRQ